MYFANGIVGNSYLKVDFNYVRAVRAGIPPVWELRVREYRVFYDVAAAEQTVYVRAIRRKPGHRTTEEIL